MKRLTVLVVLLAGIANATPTYPAVVWNAWGGDLPPSCDLCHLNGNGDKETATKPFTEALKVAGVIADNEQSLRAALNTLKTDKSDVDNDGCTDFDEVVKGADPNEVGCDPKSGPTGPRYGCGASAAPVVFSGLALLLVAAAVRRRTTRSGTSA